MTLLAAKVSIAGFGLTEYRWKFFIEPLSLAKQKLLNQQLDIFNLPPFKYLIKILNCQINY